MADDLTGSVEDTGTALDDTKGSAEDLKGALADDLTGAVLKTRAEPLTMITGSAGDLQTALAGDLSGSIADVTSDLLEGLETQPTNGCKCVEQDTN